MIEEKIDQMIQSMDLLTAALDQLFNSAQSLPNIPTTSFNLEKPKAAPIKEAPKEEAKEEAKEESTPDVKDLEGICLDIIREAGPAKKKKTKLAIKKIIKAHGGELIADCPAENLAALKVALEGVK